MKIKSRIPTTRIGTVISKTLINNFKKYAYIIKKMGIDNWELYRPMLKKSSKEFKTSKQDLLKVMQYSAILKRKGMKVKITNPVPFCITKDMNLALATLLGAIDDDGHTKIVYDPQGYFKPSYFININLGDSIKKAWKNPFLNKLKTMDYLSPKCRQCYYIKWCMGGSRFMSKSINDTYFGNDPLMNLESK